MDYKEYQFLSEKERMLPDVTGLPMKYILKSLLIKVRRKTYGSILKKYLKEDSRLVWTVGAISDADGPSANVRNYLEQKTIRDILTDLTQWRKLARACEIGCGYGRVIMVLKEFADYVKGFEREPHLVEIARSLISEIEFERVESLTCINNTEPYDFVMTCSVLQHLTDAVASDVCQVMKQLVPKGYILCIEKTDPISITENTKNGNQFISRNRSVETYQELMRPYELVKVRDRIVEPTYFNPHPGKCMLFVSPVL